MGEALVIRKGSAGGGDNTLLDYFGSFTAANDVSNQIEALSGIPGKNVHKYSGVLILPAKTLRQDMTDYENINIGLYLPTDGVSTVEYARHTSNNKINWIALENTIPVTPISCTITQTGDTFSFSFNENLAVTITLIIRGSQYCAFGVY